MSEASLQITAECKHPPRKLMPVIDRNRCEGKGPCIDVCPQNVLAMGRITADQRAQQSLKGRLKTFFHGGRQAQVLRPDACLACGQCVEACPERAIRLARFETIAHKE